MVAMVEALAEEGAVPFPDTSPELPYVGNIQWNHGPFSYNVRVTGNMNIDSMHIDVLLALRDHVLDAGGAPGPGHAVEAQLPGAVQTAAPAQPDAWAPAPICTQHGAEMKLVPSGISKKSGKPYPAFWACKVQGCNITQNLA